MTSQKQIEANRRNALKSTGPTTDHGKRRSRRNAFRHGLTAETVVKGLEDARLYKSFQAAIISDYAPLSAVEHELVLRLTSLLWRLRRATAIESDLLETQAGTLIDGKDARDGVAAPSADLYRLFAYTNPTRQPTAIVSSGRPATGDGTSDRPSARKRKTSRDVAECYLRLANITNGVLERFGRYEARLWRQARQTIAMLEAMRGSLSKVTNRSLRNAITLRDDFAERPPNRLW
jgi:hypothetical protein